MEEPDLDLVARLRVGVKRSVGVVVASGCGEAGGLGVLKFVEGVDGCLGLGLGEVGGATAHSPQLRREVRRLLNP